MVNINLIDFVVVPVLLPLFLDFGKVIVHIIAVLFAVSKETAKIGKICFTIDARNKNYKSTHTF
jgi:hypothetical protein